MLKTGFKSFVYSFSVSLFAIVSANRAFFHEKISTPSDLNIQNKSIALYLTDIAPSNAPVKKIALNSLPELQKNDPLNIPISSSKEPDPNIIVASSLEPLDIPLEFIEDTSIKTEPDTSKRQDIALADILYAPEKPLPIPEIKAEPIYTPEETIEVKIASAPLYEPKNNEIVDLKTPPPTVKTEQQKDNSLIIARNETVGEIPLTQTKNYSGVNKVHLGDPENLNHVALANSNVTVQSMAKEVALDKTEAEQQKEWKQMDDSPWVVAKSSGSKNLFMDKTYANKTKEDIKELIPIQKDKNGVMLASETAKNLIIPIPNDILEQKDITPQLAYPETSEDKLKEIDINAKIQENEKIKKLAKEEQSQTEFLTPIDEGVDIPQTQTPVSQNDLTQSQPENVENTDAKTKEGLMNALTAFFNKTAKTASETKNAVIEKTKSIKKSKSKKKAKSKPANILPTEIRLSFQPNKAEISGQTLRWIQAFATKVAQNSGLALEIRMDGTSSTTLQQKRLNLLYNILTNKGVDYSMINTVFTSRDPNSFILRTISLKEDNNNKINNQNRNSYIQW